MTPAIILTPGRQHRILRNHPWIYRTEIQDMRGNPHDGDIIDALDANRKFIARGYYNSKAMISFRALARRPVAIDDDFWRARLARAMAYRKERCGNRLSGRLVHSEADFLPGLIVDRYGEAPRGNFAEPCEAKTAKKGDTLVLQTTTLGMDLRKSILVRLLAEILKPKSILENNEGVSREFEKLPRVNSILFGGSDSVLRARIGKADFICNLFDRHKTGFYLDQQENYEIISGFARPGMRVLDGFCGLTGFAIHALLAGAKEAIAVDSNAESVKRAKESGELSGVAPRLHCRVENMFDYLRVAQKANEKFDFIILDPPTFSRSHKAIPEARRGYKEIHLRAFKILNTGGRLVTFCCAHHVSAAMFLQFILEAARDARVSLRREAVLGAAPDHPVIPEIPETEYLKGFIFSVAKE